MRKLSNKAQFLILTSVVIVGVFFTLSKYINDYSFIDTSKAAKGSEFFMFENIKEKAIKTLQISNTLNFNSRLATYKNFVEDSVADRGYTIVFSYYNVSDYVYFSMTLVSDKYILKSEFSEVIPHPTCDYYCVSLDYENGECEQNEFGQCEEKGRDYQSGGDIYCTGGEDENTCCCFPGT